MRRYIKTLDIIGHGIGIMQDAGVLPQKLQVLAGLLQEQLDEFLSRRRHLSPQPPCVPLPLPASDTECNRHAWWCRTSPAASRPILHVQRIDNRPALGIR